MLRLRSLLLLLVVAFTSQTARGAEYPEVAPRPLLLAHYMPWFSADWRAQPPEWGWHWTMNVFDPAQITAGKRQIASHYYPRIGPYDSGDAAVIEYHLRTMKLAGIDGVIVDWYGRTDHFDYAQIHRNCELVLQTAARLGLKFAVCYEDQTIPILVKGGKIGADARISHAAAELRWLEENWFQNPAYLRHEGKPVWLSFGIDGLTDAEWEQVLATRAMPSVYLSEHRRRVGADGAFDWPIPAQGLQAMEDFAARSRDWPVAMPVVFPRFNDIYGEAKVQNSYPIISADGGQTLIESLRNALKVGPPFVQIATWNDWGEGTQIEPSQSAGMGDLETILHWRREADPNFRTTENDLELPYQLWKQSNWTAASEYQVKLDGIARALDTGDVATARAGLLAIERSKFAN